MLTRRYLTSSKNLSAILDRIRDGTAPDRFTNQYLKDLGFSSSNDRAMISLLKDLGFLNDDGQPTKLYHDYRDPSRSRAVLGQAMKSTYGDLFTIKSKPSETDRALIQGKFKSAHNVGERVAELQTTTFYALLAMADLDAAEESPKITRADSAVDHKEEQSVPPTRPRPGHITELRYNIEIHLPATKDVEVFNAIFKSLKEHLID